MHDLEILRDAWVQPDPPAPAAHAAARAALLERQEAAVRLAGQGATTGTPRRRRVPGLAGHGAAGGAPRRPGSWRARRLALAATGLAIATAVGVLAIQPGGSASAGGLTVRELAYRTAAAAAAGPDVRPGQWVYWQEKSSTAVGRVVAYRVWTTADSRQAAYLSGGKIHTFKPGCRGAGGGSGECGFAGQPVVFGGGPNQPGASVWFSAGHLGVSYTALRSLPHNPQALDRYLSHLNAGPPWNHSSAPVREFMIISNLLTSYVMPPALTAELYHGLGDIPGVTVDHHAVDVAGRTGIGFRIRPPGFTRGTAYELIVNPHTYRLMASQWPSAGHKSSGVAILRRVLVSGPGVQP
jgi:hypothetical protein